ncbi:hypothetical protein [Thalassoglobus neptunius]|nr:hypothetical protein [Thalassoglobus neptunius]
MLTLVGCQTAQKSHQKECATTDSRACPPGLDSNRGWCENNDCRRPDDFGPYAVPAPLGTYVNGWNDALICSARDQQYVISRNEWFAGKEQLGPEGREHVIALATALIGHGKIVVVETEPVILEGDESLDDAYKRTAFLNEQRRMNVVAELQRNGLMDADQRVVLSPVRGVGVHGAEAPRIYNQLIDGTGVGGNGTQGGQGNGNSGLGGFGGGSGFGGGGIF